MKLCFLLVALSIGLPLPALADVDPATMTGKMLMGYQGWFACPGDGSRLPGGHHWTRGTPPEPVVEMWPDTREFDADELFPSPWTLPDGKPAMWFSSYNEKTVLRHFRWMKEAGIDGILLQRFIGEVQDPRYREFRDTVTKHVMKGALLECRVFAIEYDMSAAEAELVKRDWMRLIEELHVTEHAQYLHHRGKPVIGLWGLGFTHRPGEAAAAQALVDWLREDAPPRYRATVVGGVPKGWRTGTEDSRPGEEWAKLYRSLDVISPWTVGRYRDIASADEHRQKYIVPDLMETQRLKIDYLPVAFPGFAWKNLHGGPGNQIPRLGGKFYWRQAFNVISAGSTMYKTAMFDEVDEATAMFKTASTAAFAPREIYTSTLDADGEALPSDWYLRLAGAASRMLRKEFPLTEEIPIRP